MPSQARDFFLQGVHYVRRSIRFDTINAGNGIEATAGIPDGATHLQTFVNVVTAFNAGTTNDLVAGTAAAPTAYATSAQSVAGTAGMKVLPGSGRISGDQTPVVKFTSTGTPPTAGEADVIFLFSR